MSHQIARVRAHWICVICVVLQAVFAGAKVLRVPLEMSFNTSRRFQVPAWTSRQADGDMAPLYGGITTVGEYYAMIKVGGQPVRVQIDTGSSTIAVPLSQCSSCRKDDQRYDLTKSDTGDGKMVGCESNGCGGQTCRPLCQKCSSKQQCCSNQEARSCGFFLSYGDGSGAQGALVEDNIEFGGVTAPTVFGGILYDSEDFERPQVDGILGMAYKSLACNPTCIDPIFDVMVAEQKVEHDIFTICMNERGGSLVLGGYDEAMGKTAPSYVDILATEGQNDFYRIGLTGKMTVDGHELEMPNFRTAIVDSGTTLVVVGSAVFEELSKYLLETDRYCESVPDLCVRNTWFKPSACVPDSEKLIKAMPTLGIPLEGGLTLELLPEHYLIPYVQRGQTYRCVGIMNMDNLDINVILGNTLNMKYLTVYDRENSRIGFAEAAPNCGGTMGCSSAESCEECAGNSECAYDYNHQICVDRDTHGSIFPYPYCHGHFCLCKAKRYIPWFSATLLGLFVGAVFGLLIMAFLRWRKSRQTARAFATIRVDDNDYEF